IWYASAGGPGQDANTSGGRLLLSLTRRQLIHFPSQTTVVDLSLFDVKPALVDNPPATARAIQPDDTASTDPQVVAYEIQPGDPYNDHPNARLILYWRRPKVVQALRGYNLAVRFKDAARHDWADWF